MRPYGALPYVLLCVIWAGEIPTLFRRRAEAKENDRGSYWLFYAVLGGGFCLAFALPALAHSHPAFAAVYRSCLIGAWADPVAAAFVLMGTAFRLWSVRTLGRYFTRVVQVSADQPVVSAGPYRRLRHPSYAGSLTALLAVGLSLRDWLAFAVVAVTSGICFGYRVRVEEQALLVAIGRPYRDYMARTKRLLPFIY